MTGPLGGIEAKIDRADKHLNELKEEVRAFLDTNPYRADLEFDPDPVKTDIRFTVERQPPITWSVIFGDWVHNLRSALDHLVWQVVLASGAKPGRWTCFPIYDDVDAFNRDVRDRWIAHKRSPLLGVAKGTLDAFEYMQPYHRHGGNQQGLSILHGLSVVDKHRFVNASLVALTDQDPVITGTGFDFVEIDLATGPVEDGAVVGSVTLHGPPDTQVQMNCRLIVDVRFGDIKLPLSKCLDLRNAVVTVLNHFGQGFGVKSP